MVLFQVFQHRRIFNILLQLAKDNKIQGCTVNLFRVRIDEACFEEKRRAVEVLVINICVDTQIIKGKPVAIITVTYRFDDPDSSSPALLEAPARFVAENSTSQRR